MVTSEMRDWFIKRTNNHINLVRQYLDKADDVFQNKYSLEIQQLKDKHDQSKFEEPERTPYIFTTWRYYCKDRDIPFQIDEVMERRMHNATFHHVISNSHHPEYWDDTLISNPINFENRDKPSGVLIHAYKMPPISLIEMCCDWCAVSKERGNTPISWADMNVNKRWLFDDNQVNFIYSVLNKIWTDPVKVFLGGTCNNSEWRKELIPILQQNYISFFNPVVDDWTPECQAEEEKQKQICDISLYYITKEMTGVFSIAEAVDDSNKKPEKTIFAFDPNGFDEGQIKSLNAVNDMIVKNNAIGLGPAPIDQVAEKIIEINNNK